MGRKFTLVEVREFAKNLGYEVISNEYIDTKTYMKFKCLKCGTLVEKTFDNFKRRNNCPECDNLKARIAYTKEVIENTALENNIKVLTHIRENGIHSFIKLKCLDCNHEFDRVFINFKNNPTCPKCRVNSRQLTYEDAKSFIEIESNSNCEFLCTKDEYKQKRISQPQMALCKFNFRCKCGNTFQTDLNTFKSGNKRQCNECSFKETNKRKRYRYEEVKEIIEVNSESGCKLVSEEYISYHSPLKIQCSCGNFFNRTLAEFKGRKLFKCYDCTGASKPITYEDVVKELNNHNIDLLSISYKNNMDKLHIKCEEGHESYRSLANIRKSRYSCPYCNNKGYKRNTETFAKEVNDVTNGEYKLIDEYKNMNHYVLIRHIECGHEWLITPHNFLDSGNRCPVCNNSKGELTIKKLLDDNIINYKRQYHFEDLLGDYNPLKFDFAIFNDTENKQLKCLVEYDGEFHYQPIKGEGDLKRQQRYDGYKNNYCKENNIKLIRIPYWEFDNIENILKEVIK